MASVLRPKTTELLEVLADEIGRRETRLRLRIAAITAHQRAASVALAQPRLFGRRRAHEPDEYRRPDDVMQLPESELPLTVKIELIAVTAPIRGARRRMIAGLSGSLLSESALENSGAGRASRAARRADPVGGAATPAAVAPSRPRDARSVGRRSNACSTRSRRRCSADWATTSCPTPWSRWPGPPRLRRFVAFARFCWPEAGGWPPCVVTGWGQDAGAAWRDAVRHGIASTVRWCFCLTGPSLRVIDSERTYSRRFIAFDLDTAIDDERTFGVLWGLLRAEAMAAKSAADANLLERAIGISEAHRASVRSSLQQGVDAALAHLLGAFAAGAPRQSSKPRRTGARKHIRRVADRHLPHPLPALRRGPGPGSALASRLPRRLHHRVAADADRAAAAAARPVGDDAIDRPARASRVPRRLAARDSLQRPPVLACRLAAGRACAARRRRGAAGAAGVDDAGRRRVGGERICVRGSRRRTTGRRLRARARSGPATGTPTATAEPRPDRPRGRTSRGGRRKTTGSFYTPRSLTEYLVRRTLAPLIHGAGPDRILSLRIVDPAMGSGAFIVAACRYLAAAYEAGARRRRRRRARRHFRRRPRRLPTRRRAALPLRRRHQPDGGAARPAVALARHARGRPSADVSRSSASSRQQPASAPGVENLSRQPSGGRRRSSQRSAPLPLFDDEPTLPGCGSRSPRARPSPTSLAIPSQRCAPRNARWRELDCPRRTARQARGRQRRLVCVVVSRTCPASGRRRSRPAPRFAGRARRAAGRTSPAPMLEALRATIAHRGPLLSLGARVSRGVHDERQPSQRTGFDAVIGNPPWEMLRDDSGDGPAARASSSALVRLRRAALASTSCRATDMPTSIRLRRTNAAAAPRRAGETRARPAVGRSQPITAPPRSGARCSIAPRSTRSYRSRTATACFPSTAPSSSRW